ncbi:MAG: methylated-DNA--[protein]-cysteine S-methyltransferase [Bacteroidota bacterium]
MNTEAVTAYRSPIGWIRLEASELGLRQVEYVDAVPEDADPATSHPILRQGLAALRAYFEKNEVPAVPLDVEGTTFQKNVWKTLEEIPFGTSWSYKDLAVALGDAKKVRAVGLANGKNPISILVPCHRVIGADGSLTGYAGGLDKKQWLLNHEGIRTVESLAAAQMNLF